MNAWATYSLAVLRRTDLIQYVSDFARAMRIVERTGKPHYFNSPNGTRIAVFP